eukprot:TRINITY_DN32363_c0_g1_i1.p1 TRINITY_DN32363_c0_g1~~TRINITY_DN32363_c0_g1_i1.p1  ORF type:complete len:749 (+),score=169.32 TRINITY_DN32363_c0_g1_i1:112-2358(+)
MVQKAVAVAHHIPPERRASSRPQTSKASHLSHPSQLHPHHGPRAQTRAGSRSPAPSKDEVRQIPSTAPANSARSTPFPSKGKPNAAWTEMEEEVAEQQVVQYRRAAVEEILSKQQRDLHIMVAMHHDQLLTLLQQHEEAATEAMAESLHLKNKVADLTRKNNEFHSRALDNHSLLPCPNCSTQNLLEKELKNTQKVLLKRDEAARVSQAENAELRERLQELLSLQQQLEPNGTGDGIEEMSIKESQDDLSQTISSNFKAPKPPMTAFSVSSTNGSKKKASPPAGFDLLGELKLPGQQYDDREGNFFTDPEVESGDDDPTWHPPESSPAAFVRKKAMRAGGMLDVRTRMEQLFSDKATNAHLLHDKGCAQRIVKGTVFENFTLLVILSNVLWIGADTLVNDADLLLDADLPVILLENAFCCYFTFELGIRFLAYKSKFFIFKDWWFLFDSLLVGMMIIETWVMVVIAVVTNSAGLEIRNAGVLRVLRLVRLVRVGRVMRVLRAVPEVMILVKALAVASRTVLFTLCLLGAVIYVFGIAFTTMSKDFAVREVYFRDLWGSMFTLTFYACLGDGLTDLAIACFQANVLLALLFCVYILFAPLTVLNMIVAVMVEVVSQIAVAERENLTVAHVQESIIDLLRELDTDRNQLISVEEFAALLENKDHLAALHDVGLDVVQLMENPDMIFGTSSELSFKEFVDEILLLRVNNAATLKDLVHMRKTLVHEVGKLIGKQMQTLKKKDTNFLYKPMQ